MVTATERYIIAAVIVIGAAGLSGAANRPVARWTVQSGTSGTDVARGAAADAEGNVYLVGYTSGSLNGFTGAGGADIAVLKYTPAGALEWAYQTGTAADDFGYGVAVDSAGSVYVAGATYGGLHGFVSAGGADIFLIKLSPAGVRQWTVQAGTAQNDEGLAAGAGGGNVYVAGYTGGSLGGNPNIGGRDAFLMQFVSSGIAQWVRQPGTIFDETAWAVAVDTAGSVYIAGQTGGSLGGTPVLGGDDLFLAAYDGAGAGRWTRLLGSTADDAAFSVALSSDSVYVAGAAAGGFDGNASLGGTDAVLARFGLDGNRRWSKQFGTSGHDSGTGVIFHAGTVYVTGNTAGNFGGSIGGADGFLLSFDVLGATVASAQFGTAAADAVFAGAGDPSGSVVAAGWTAGGSAGGANLGREDFFAVSFSTNTGPFLRWTDESGYTLDGIEPDEMTGTTSVVYRVRYSDTDGDAPLADYPKVRVYRDNAEISGSPFILSAAVPGTTAYVDGIIFSNTLSLPEGTYAYRFEAFDRNGLQASGEATGLRGGPVFRPAEAQNVRIIHGVFKPALGETATLSYTLDRDGDIGVKVYDSLGVELRELFRGTAGAGTATVAWDGKNAAGEPVASGVYVIRIDPGGGKQRKVVVIR